MTYMEAKTLLSDLKPIVADMNIKYDNKGDGLILASLNGLQVARIKEVEPNKHYEVFMESISQEIVKKETKKQVNYYIHNACSDWILGSLMK